MFDAIAPNECRVQAAGGSKTGGTTMLLSSRSRVMYPDFQPPAARQLPTVPRSTNDSIPTTATALFENDTHRGKPVVSTKTSETKSTRKKHDTARTRTHSNSRPAKREEPLPAMHSPGGVTTEGTFSPSPNVPRSYFPKRSTISIKL